MADLSTWEDLAHVETAQLLLDTDIFCPGQSGNVIVRIPNFDAFDVPDIYLGRLSAIELQRWFFLIVTHSAYHYAMKRRLNEYNDDARVLNGLLDADGVDLYVWRWPG